VALSGHGTRSFLLPWDVPSSSLCCIAEIRAQNEENHHVPRPRFLSWWIRSIRASVFAVDYGEKDSKVLSYALSEAKRHNASLYLFHIVEGVSGQLFGKQAFDEEARYDKEHLESIASELRKQGVEVITVLGYGNVPRQIVKLSNENAIDLLIMGAHGHRGLRDIISAPRYQKFGTLSRFPCLWFSKAESLEHTTNLHARATLFER